MLKIVDHSFRLVPPIGGIEPVEIGKISDFIFPGQTGQLAQPKSCEHFEEVGNAAIER